MVIAVIIRSNKYGKNSTYRDLSRGKRDSGEEEEKSDNKQLVGDPRSPSSRQVTSGHLTRPPAHYFRSHPFCYKDIRYVTGGNNPFVTTYMGGVKLVKNFSK